MKMPEKLYVRLADSDVDCIDPATVDSKTDEMYFTLTETAEETAQTNDTVIVAEYQLVRMVAVKSKTTVETSVEPVV